MKIKTKQWLEANMEKITEEWFEFLRFPTVGVNPAHLQDCAKWRTA